jgi:5-methylcytosine-specific restriction enzyme subunit McrC
MSNNNKNITVFEHQSLTFDLKIKEESDLLDAMVKFFGKGVPYYTLIRNGVKFNEYVGVIQIGNHIIEVLPKADKRNEGEETENTWRTVLVDMIRAVHSFEVKAPTGQRSTILLCNSEFKKLSI